MEFSFCCDSIFFLSGLFLWPSLEFKSWGHERFCWLRSLPGPFGQIPAGREISWMGLIWNFGHFGSASGSCGWCCALSRWVPSFICWQGHVPAQETTWCSHWHRLGTLWCWGFEGNCGSASIPTKLLGSHHGLCYQWHDEAHKELRLAQGGPLGSTVGGGKNGTNPGRGSRSFTDF